MSTKFEVGKEYETRGGDKVRIYAVGVGKKGDEMHGAIFQSDYWSQAAWYVNGEATFNSFGGPFDLVLPKRGVWINWYGDGKTCAFTSREGADRNATLLGSRRACVYVEEGDGL